MKTISMSLLVLVVLSASLTGWQLLSPSGSYIIGGAYVIHGGKVVNGNLQAFFAQIILEDGARVEGRIVLVSSTLDVAGSVSGKILAVDSDITIRETARLNESVRRADAVPYILLLPEITRSNSALMR